MKRTHGAGARFALTMTLLLAGACSSGDDGREGSEVDTSGLPGTPPTGTTSQVGGQTGLSGAGVTGQAGTPLGLDEVVSEDGCNAQISAPPSSTGLLDIIWVVDASGSMLDEQKKIGANITKFADDITSAAVDVRIVMLTDAATIPVVCPVVDPDPAAETALNGDPRYRFIQARVNSQNSLEIAVDYFPEYQSFLRPAAVTHFIVVTDDDSEYRGSTDPAQQMEAFQNDMGGLLGSRFTLHTISSEGPNPCRHEVCMPDLAETGICAFVELACGASAPGTTYWELAKATGGIATSICQEDWSNIFEPLTQQLVASASLPCQYTIPPPDGANLFVPEEVNVSYRASDGADPEYWPRVLDGASSCESASGWYFDNDASPTTIVLCPSTCAVVEQGGTINLSYGCVEQILR